MSQGSTCQWVTVTKMQGQGLSRLWIVFISRCVSLGLFLFPSQTNAGVELVSLRQSSTMLRLETDEFTKLRIQPFFKPEISWISFLRDQNIRPDLLTWKFLTATTKDSKNYGQLQRQERPCWTSHGSSGAWTIKLYGFLFYGKGEKLQRNFWSSTLQLFSLNKGVISSFRYCKGSFSP